MSVKKNNRVKKLNPAGRIIRIRLLLPLSGYL